MDYCPNCGSETGIGAKTCWECHEPLQTEAPLEAEPLDELDLDADVSTAEKPGLLEDLDTESDDDQPRSPEVQHQVSASDDEEPVIAGHSVVAYVAQDEVQAGTISQLLSDCGIRNFASLEEDDSRDDEGVLQVQVLEEDLETAQQIIADFTSECDDRRGPD